MIPEISSLANVAAKTDPKTDPKEVAAKVQGMFLEVMLKAMEESVDAEDGLFGNSTTSDIYRGMLREHLASAISGNMRSPLEGAVGRALEDRGGSEIGDHVISNLKLQTGDSKISDFPSSPVSSVPDTPTLPVNGIISSPEGWRRDPINGETRYHAGTDIAAPSGTPIHAVAAGRVIESGVKSGYGNTVVIETEDGRQMLYAHNNRNFVQVGDQVSSGQQIAEVGSTGRATGPHVHFEVKF
jgi:murein DD-endopeptidase MepM/ murein hydrolase activator NlpD